jgi:hypothetical protein
VWCVNGYTWRAPTAPSERRRLPFGFSGTLPIILATGGLLFCSFSKFRPWGCSSLFSFFLSFSLSLEKGS